MKDIKLISGSLAVVAILAACGELLTTAPTDSDLLDAPVAGLTPEETAVFLRGDAEFGRQFGVDEGLGPIFNNVACASCHSGDGRGRPENALVRLGTAPDFAAAMGGPQIQDKAIRGAVAEVVPTGIPVSVRLPPPVFGVGLIEAIPVEAILANADPDDSDGDGISGRPNWVNPAPFVPASEVGGGSGMQLGRFSRKAQVSSLFEQVVAAYHQDMGITSDFLPAENLNPFSAGASSSADLVADPEITASTVRAVVDYVALLAAPAPGATTEGTRRGQQLFGDVGCADCHVPSFETGPSRFAALEGRTVTLYSDLLLHDMGDALADGRPDGTATGTEWRTTPLWGMRLVREFLNGDMFLMHDGRARSIDEAIRLHGGEAASVRDAYLGLDSAGQSALIEFVESR